MGHLQGFLHLQRSGAQGVAEAKEQVSVRWHAQLGAAAAKDACRTRAKTLECVRYT